MTNLIRWRDEQGMLPLLLAASLILLLAVAAAVVWARGGVPEEFTHFASARMQRAFDRVEPGRTLQPQLAALGFDATRLKARTLSGLGVQEYFMPGTSEDFDRLDPAIRACFDAPDRCSVQIFPMGPPAGKPGFMAANAAPREPARFVFLLKSGRVAYKTISGT
ncbi:MAG TPA: hypothetical protein VGC16_11710 [Rhizomicrobium sp.]